eukprot:2997715-Pleurochrysis_carterae.AAC.3
MAIAVKCGLDVHAIACTVSPIKADYPRHYNNASCICLGGFPSSFHVRLHCRCCVHMRIRVLEAWPVILLYLLKCHRCFCNKPVNLPTVHSS